MSYPIQAYPGVLPEYLKDISWSSSYLVAIIIHVPFSQHHISPSVSTMQLEPIFGSPEHALDSLSLLEYLIFLQSLALNSVV